MRSNHKSLFLLAAVLLLTVLLGAGTAGQVAAVSDTLVINEIDYDQPSTDAAEYIEIRNISSSAVSLDLWKLELINGTGGGATVYDTIALPAVTLASGDYFVVCANAATVVNCDLDDGPDTNFVQNGAPDAVGLRNGSTLIDAVSYEGDSGAPYTEGSGTGLVDDGVNATESISRCPDGVDTDQNNIDFTLRPITPGAANDCGVVVTVEPKINEFVFNHVGTDTNEYVEVVGDPDTNYSAYSVLQIEGDTTGSGVIDSAHVVGMTNATGHWSTVFLSNAFENGSVTLLLVEGFSGSAGTDLDTNNDGVFDTTPWTSLVDDVAVSDGGSGDFTYSATVLAPGFGSSPFTPGGASRIPDGTDTNTVADWVLNDFDLAGIPGFPGTIVLGEAYNTPGAPNAVFVPPPEMCGDPYTFIYDVQGPGPISPVAGTEVAVEGVVVGDFQNNASPDDGNLNGFHVQDPLGDGNVLTSDGIFIYAPGGVDVAAGDAVRARGVVSEFNGMTEITASQIWICGTGTVAPTTVSLPVTAVNDLEKYEGMYVTFPQNLYISEYFNFDRFGEIVLTTTRRWTPTAVVEPGPPAIAMAQDYLLNRITLDDGRTASNPDPAIHPNGNVFDLTNLFRGGDIVSNVTGVLDYSFSLYRIQPTQGADYTPNNPRTAAPDPVGGSIQVASFNVLNYFTTIDTGAWICGPLQNQECRGADTPEEFQRQRMKIITATAALDADVIGLIEIENHPGDVPTADLVAGLNDLLGPGTFDYIATGAYGTDAIRQAFIYRPAEVTPIGDFAILDQSVDPRFLDDYNRPVLAQTFLDNSTGGVVTVAVNHLKSKGSDCNAIGDPDIGDGQGNCNLTRKAAAQALVDWLESDPTGLGAGNYLIIGDLNSYDKEDPIDAIRAGADDILGTADDYTDLLYQFVGEFAYSYVFDGQLGYLDHGLASAGLMSQVIGATAWHINADEADLIDYDMSFKLPPQDAIYAPDAYRSSDHDPVIVGLQPTPVDEFVTGGGWINSPAGAYPADPSLAGRGTFGFVAMYEPWATVPTGSVEFRFHPAKFDFKSDTFDWLVVSGNTATFHGWGMVDGQGWYEFILTATDGDPDSFWIKIWYEDASGNPVVVYDNGPGTPLARGSIVIHRPLVDLELAR